MASIPIVINIINQKLKQIRAYLARIAVDGGLLKNQSITQQYYELIKQNNIPKPVFSWFGEAGTKERVSGIYRYATKLYSMFTPVARYGPELVVNGGFDSDSGWTKGVGWTISEGVLNVSTDTATNSNQNAGLAVGIKVKLTYTVLNYISGRIQPQIGGVYGSFVNGNGTYTGIFTTINGFITFWGETGVGFNGSIDNVSCVEVLNSLDGSPTDATQTTSTSQPYLSGNIAPNEKLCLKNGNGDNRYMTHPTISFAANEAWSASYVFNPNGSNTGVNSRIAGNDTASKTRIELAPGGATLTVYGETASGSLAIAQRKGKSTIIQLSYDGAGVITVYMRGVSVGTIACNSAFTFNTLFRASGTNPIFGQLQGAVYRIGQLTASTALTEFAFLRNIYPEIPSVTIGSQTWATSNCEMAATPQGTLIQEMQTAANVENITNSGYAGTTDWVDSNADGLADGLGAVVNGIASIITGNGFTGNAQRIDRLIAGNSYIATFSIITIGKYYKITGKYRTDATTTIGNGITPALVLESNVGNPVSFSYFVLGTAASIRFYISGNWAEFDELSIQEIGWAGSTELYDGIYAQTAGTVEQKTYAAVKAAAMWSYYNNDVAIGSVYGKLYNWYAVKLLQMDIDYYNTANPTTPWGWKVPSDTDFNNAATTLGGASVAGGKMKKEGLVYWNTPNTGADNSSGFSGLGGGQRNQLGSVFDLNGRSRFWTVTKFDSILAFAHELWANSAAMDANANKQLFAYGCSLRLIKS